MPSLSLSITPSRFCDTQGRAGAPVVLDVRRDAAFRASDRMLPTARHCPPERVAQWAAGRPPGHVTVYCMQGHEVSQGAAAELAAAGWHAHFLEGGIEGHVAAGLPSLRKRPDLGVPGETPSRWITRERPKIDRIACPWLVRRFIDAQAAFFYVPTAQVFDEAARLKAVAYDIPRAPISHDGERCSFDMLLHAFDLHDPALDRLARIVRGADTDRLDLSAPSAGLLALSLGLSRLHADDRAMLEAAMPLYDALYAWCRDQAAGHFEPHNWNPAAMTGGAR